MFNVDPHQDNLADSLDAALSATEKKNQQRAGKSPHTYALIDGVFDQKWGGGIVMATKPGSQCPLCTLAVHRVPA